MTWGNGNGYGQQDDVYGRLDNTKPVGGARFPFIEDGRHKLVLVTLEEFMHSTDGPSARALFEVLESSKHQVGSYVVKIWKITRPPKFANGKTDADEFVDFCRKLKNAPQNIPMAASIRTLMKDRPREQLARGTVIDCTGVPNKKGNWVNVYWNAVEQTPDQIAQHRARLEQKGIPDTGSTAASQPPQNPYQGQQQGYALPPAPPQYAPPQQQYAPPQQGYPQMQNPVPQQAPVAAPQGGFLAQLPPQGGNHGGGNQGGAW